MSVYTEILLTLVMGIIRDTLVPIVNTVEPQKFRDTVFLSSICKTALHNGVVKGCKASSTTVGRVPRSS